MKRRDLIQSIGAGAALGTVPWMASTASAATAPYFDKVPEIYAPVPRPVSHSKAIVIGSGFGGAVSALRLAQAGVQTTVLERGFQWPKHPTRDIFTQDTLPDGRGFWFRNMSKSVYGLPGTPVQSFAGVMDITEYQNIDVWRGACVGGGSVVFTGAMPQPIRSYFDALFESRVNYDEMDKVFYPRVRQMLRLSPMPADIYYSGPFGHSRAWDARSRNAGYTPTAVDSIWNWDVVRAELRGTSTPSCTVARSSLGNSNGAKYDLNQNYLAQAQATGQAKVYAGQVVKNIYFDGNRYVVDVNKINPEGRSIERYSLTCDMLFLAAGSIGTTEMLVRARALGHLPQLNEFVGTGWGTNGDTAIARSFAFGGGSGIGAGVGAACASRIHDTRGPVPVTLENWYSPGLPLNLGIDASLGITFERAARANFAYEAATDRVRLLWPANGNDAAIAAARAVNNRVAAANFVVPGVPFLVRDVSASFTAHPLGGAVLNKATDNFGRVKGYNRLYVMDGAAIPGNTGAVNPSLTISALAERNIANIIASGG